MKLNVFRGFMYNLNVFKKKHNKLEGVFQVLISFFDFQCS